MKKISYAKCCVLGAAAGSVIGSLFFSVWVVIGAGNADFLHTVFGFVVLFLLMVTCACPVLVVFEGLLGNWIYRFLEPIKGPSRTLCYGVVGLGFGYAIGSVFDLIINGKYLEELSMRLPRFYGICTMASGIVATRLVGRFGLSEVGTGE